MKEIKWLIIGVLVSTCATAFAVNYARDITPLNHAVSILDGRIAELERRIIFLEQKNDN